ncbi:efflux RND transporter periplasmic adaptor subunit [Hydrogenophaga sp. A37]|uniref:efflux RND transporter periplasmic adaptor subunit n=1 Tax=Hydrogenophaga sp. A37 TaxID=1945864 RepID=UPI00098553F6|nr:efflux RND transporter periplasmic adaptor subunit [Hydrogenophaga sp. A37]OOG84146.1 efflux transporter periplasmic adaptor subunit [Hydrogenophaga sp. A37]
MNIRPLILVSTAALLLTACSKPEAPQEPIRAVKLLKVSSGTVRGQSEYAGEVKARTESRLGFRLGGKVTQRPVEVGQRVVAGQLLAQLDAQDFVLSSQAAQAQVSATQTQRDLAAADLKRYMDLKNQGFVSGAEIERRQATLQAADASLRQARAQGSVQGNQAAYARLLADGAGVVLSVDAEVGQVVAAGTPVVRLARDGARDVVIAVPEDKLAQVRIGQVAQVRLWGNGMPGQAPLGATVREVAASADPVTRTFQVKLALPADASAALGATATVSLSATGGVAVSAIKLPTSALMRAPGGAPGKTAVWVFDSASHAVVLRPVVVGGADGNDLLIAEGLKDGEEVVAAGVHVLSPGQKVTRFAAPATE